MTPSRKLFLRFSGLLSAGIAWLGPAHWMKLDNLLVDREVLVDHAVAVESNLDRFAHFMRSMLSDARTAATASPTEPTK